MQNTFKYWNQFNQIGIQTYRLMVQQNQTQTSPYHSDTMKGNLVLTTGLKT